MAEIEESFEFKICEKIFKTKENLWYHETNKVCENKDHVCEHCKNTFTSVPSMQRHINQFCKVKKQRDEEEKRRKAELATLRKEKERRLTAIDGLSFSLLRSLSVWAEREV